jgi:hypothetical protein
MLAGYGAFPFIRRFLAFNQYFPEESLVEVVLLSRNSTAMGLWVFRSIAHDELDISRAAFTSGASPFPYIPAFNTPLFFCQPMRRICGRRWLRVCRAGWCCRVWWRMSSRTASCGLRSILMVCWLMMSRKLCASRRGLSVFMSMRHTQGQGAAVGFDGESVCNSSRPQELENRLSDQNPNNRCLLRTALLPAMLRTTSG